MLAERLKQLVDLWLKEFTEFGQKREAEIVLVRETVKHELHIREQRIYVEPPLEFARYCLYRDFHRVLGIIATLPRLQAD